MYQVLALHTIPFIMLIVVLWRQVEQDVIDTDNSARDDFAQCARVNDHLSLSFC